MLRLILGRGKSGKTSVIMEEIRTAAGKDGRKKILIVPEQYSHEAERYLSLCCGDSISLYGEVLSFSRLCGRVFQTVGGGGASLDAGGKMLVMELAVKSAAGKLKIYGGISRRPEFLKELIAASDEFKTCRVNTEKLWDAGESASGSIGDKLHDLALILGSYDAIAARTALDPRDRMNIARDKLEESGIPDNSDIYIDGFVDFSAQEMAIIEEFIRLGSNVTVALSCDGIGDNSDIFKFSGETARRLVNTAEEFGVKVETVYKDGRDGFNRDEFACIEKGFYDPDYCAPSGTNAGAVKLVSLPEPSAECEYIAGEILKLIHRGTCRYRDIAVMGRGFDEYEGLIESIFGRYGIPVYLGRKADIMQKPILMLVSSVLDILTDNWSYDSVFRYLKTGLAGISPSDCDILENYVIAWNIRGRNMWCGGKDWDFGTEGYKGKSDDDRLAEINRLRQTVTAPVMRLYEKLKKEENAANEVMALYNFMEDIALAQRLEEKAEEFRNIGRAETAEEYAQLWNILVSAMEQCHGVLGDMPMGVDEFARFFKLLLSRYEVGSIPASIDCVAAGDMSRIRKRNIKYLFIIGASDDKLPMISTGSGILSEDEKNILGSMGIKLPGGTTDNLLRELNMIYQSVILPEEELVVTYPRKSASGEERQPSYVIVRLKKIFDMELERLEDIPDADKILAEKPCLELAASAIQNGESRYGTAAKEYFRSTGRGEEELKRALTASKLDRGRLSSASVEKLYGREIRLSASRVDKYYSCKYSYFLHCGLKAKPRIKGEFDASVFGTFVHYILEHVTSRVKELGGFSQADDDTIRKLTDLYVKKFVNEELGGMENKSGRFIYLFNRLRRSVDSIVENMAQELKNSDFAPIDFELEFSADGDLPASRVSEDGISVTVTGFVDRVDGWVNDGKLYLRIADYKTGKKTFDMSDVWYGMGMQMLIYLFTLEKYGAQRYGMEVVPAGVMYSPARDIYIQGERDMTEEEIDREISKKLVRSGLFLNNAEVLEAMEHGDKKKYIPVKLSENGFTGSLADMEQLGKLKKHVERTLLAIVRELRQGNIEADPYYKQAMDTACRYCKFFEACHFDRSRGDRPRFLKHISREEVWEKMEDEA